MKLNFIKAGLLICSLLLTVCLNSQPVVESWGTNTGSSSSASIDKPSGVSADDMLVVGLTFEKGSDEDLTPPTGWTLIRRTDNSSNSGLATYYKIAGASEPSSYSFDLDNGSKWCIGIVRLSDVDDVSPIDVSSGNTGSGTSTVASSVTTTGNSELILLYYTNKKDANYSTPSGATEVYDDPNSSGGQPSNMLAYTTQAVAGATGDYTSTATESESWAAQQIAFVSGFTPLPIELLDFQAQVCQNTTVCLNWKTETEVDNDYFTIYHSVDGLNWISIATIKGAGYSVSPLDYFATHEIPANGLNYYRLSSTDYSGYTEMEGIQTVIIKSRVQQNPKIHPNPTNGIATLNTVVYDPVLLRLFNMQGKDLTAEMGINLNSGSNITLDFSNLPEGIYILQSPGGPVRVQVY